MIRAEKFPTNKSKEEIENEDSKFPNRRKNERLNTFFSWVDCREKINHQNEGNKKSIGESIEESSKYVNKLSERNDLSTFSSNKRVVRTLNNNDFSFHKNINDQIEV